MEIISINVGRPRLVQYQARTISTAIFKYPVAGPVEVTELGIAGDDQADKSVHGGRDKAVHAYAEESYVWWRRQLEDRELPPGTFGENLTVGGLTDDQVMIGDVYRAGSAVLQVTQPRQPCLKLGIKMADAAFVKQFHHAGRPGFYLRVMQPGTIQANDQLELVERADHSMSVAEIYQVRFASPGDRSQLGRAADLPGLSAAWRDELCQRIDSC